MANIKTFDVIEKIYHIPHYEGHKFVWEATYKINGRSYDNITKSSYHRLNAFVTNNDFECVKHEGTYTIGVHIIFHVRRKGLSDDYV